MKKKNLKNLKLNKMPISNFSIGQIKGGTNIDACRIPVPRTTHTAPFKCSVLYCPPRESNIICS